jgi:dienelactone hydrolase
MIDRDRLISSAALFVSVLISSSIFARPPSQPTRPALESGTWIGGIGSLDDDTLSWLSVRAEIEQDADDLSGRLRTDDGRRYSIRVLDYDGDFKLAVERKKKRLFNCKVLDGAIVGTIEDSVVPNKLMLRRIVPQTAERLSQLTGVYETDDGHRISFSHRGEGLSMTNFTTGMIRFLYPTGDDHFVAGPAIAIPAPIETEFQFQQDSTGAVTKVTIQPVGKSSFDARRRPGPQVEDFVYKSFDGTKIAGSLYRPAGDGPFPAFVWVHGSGPATRFGAGSWPLYFADLGFAVLAVDKRGVGRSDGKYSLPSGGRDNFPHMRRRSRDVAEAVKALAARDDILNDRIGLVGGSQAGWVIPMSTQHTDLAFAIILYGGATPLSVEGRYSSMASENSSGAKLKSVDVLIDELRSYEPSDVGIDSELSQIKFPTLWIYGYQDRSNPSQICEQLINEIGVRNNRDFTVKAFPTGNHGMLDCRFGGSAESGTLSQLVPDLHATINEWLEEKNLLPGEGR